MKKVKKMLIDAGLILEGGGTRCAYTVGILDFLMENDFYFKHVYSVSASAYAAINYIAKQKGRAKECSIDYMAKENIFTWRSLLTTGSVYNTGLLFDRLPNKEVPFDFDSFFNSDMNLTMSVTDMKTGEPVYYNEFGDNKRLMDICCASNSFPVITHIQYIDGRPVLDGGMADAIPIHKALADGIEKCIVVLTQPKGFRKKVKKNRIIMARYFRYGKFVEMVNKRPEFYNSTLDYIEELDKDGKIMSFYPEIDPPPLICRKTDVLNAFYRHGYEHIKQKFPEIKRYLGLE